MQHSAIEFEAEQVSFVLLPKVVTFGVHSPIQALPP